MQRSPAIPSPPRVDPAALLAAVVALAASAGLAPLAAQSFGGAVAVSGGEILVGEADSEREPGAVYAFERGDGEWIEVARLESPDPHTGDGFGAAIARDGELLVVGAPGAADGSGVVHVFTRGGGGWTHAGTLQRQGATEFGSGLAVAGDQLLVAAPDAGANRLRVFAYRRSPSGSWEPAGELAPPAGARAGEAFGGSLALSGELAVIGSPAEDERTGAAYVYRFEDGVGWRLASRIAAPEDLGAGAGAGVAVAIAGDELLVGAPGVDRFLGTVLRYEGTPESGWTPAGRIEPEGLESPAGFGAGLAVDGDDLLIGAPAVGGGFGEVIAMRRTATGWERARALQVEGEGRLQAGAVLALSDGVGVLGLPADEFGAGTAWVLSADGGRWEPEARIFSEQVPLPAITGGQIDCARGAARGFDCEEVDLLSFLPRESLGAGRGARLNNVWGWTDSETGGEYAIVGRMDGTAFVDVSDPHDPRYLGNLDKHEGSRSNTWRDMKVYADHAFIVADGAGDHGMQVFDLRQLRDVDAPREFTETAHYDRIASAHNIVINETSGYAYIVGASGGGETCGGGLHMVDLREPANPTFAGCFAHENTGRRGTGYSHDAQCVIYHGPDEAYRGHEICIGANETALSIADVSEKDAPVAIATASYPNVAYAHQGWLTEDHRYFYSNDELDEVQGLVDATRTLVWDVTDLDDPTLVREYYSPTKATDHNLYVAGNRLYMSNNRSGLRVLDVSDPESPEEIGVFDTTPWSEDAAGFDGSWSVYPYFESGIILLSSRREGLFVVRPRDERLVP